jgi:hypothetical protein
MFLEVAERLEELGVRNECGQKEKAKSPLSHATLPLNGYAYDMWSVANPVLTSAVECDQTGIAKARLAAYAPSCEVTLAVVAPNYEYAAGATHHHSQQQLYASTFGTQNHNSILV